MFTLIRTAVRFFFVGVGVGVLLAPRAGAETRQIIRDKLNELVGTVLEAADLPPVEPAETGGTRKGARTAKGDETGAATAKT